MSCREVDVCSKRSWSCISAEKTLSTTESSRIRPAVPRGVAVNSLEDRTILAREPLIEAEEESKTRQIIHYLTTLKKLAEQMDLPLVCTVSEPSRSEDKIFEVQRCLRVEVCLDDMIYKDLSWSFESIKLRYSIPSRA